MNSLDFFGQNDFSIFFNECHIDLGSIRLRKMLLLSECKTVSCIFMQYSAPKTLKISNRQNIGYTTYFQPYKVVIKVVIILFLTIKETLRIRYCMISSKRWTYNRSSKTAKPQKLIFFAFDLVLKLVRDTSRAKKVCLNYCF